MSESRFSLQDKRLRNIVNGSDASGGAGDMSVNRVLERDDVGDFGTEQMPRAQQLLRAMHIAVGRMCGGVLLPGEASPPVTYLADGTPMPRAAVELYATGAVGTTRPSGARTPLRGSRLRPSRRQRPGARGR